jgi:hypothetical protein
MADSTLLPDSVLFVDTNINAEAKRRPERKLWKCTDDTSSVCPLYNALVDNKYRIREQVLTLDQPHAYFWNAVDIDMPEGRNQVLLQTFRPQHDLGDTLGKEAADKMARNQLETCAKHKAQFDKFASKDDDGWEFLASTLQFTNASERRGRRILLVAPRRSRPSEPITYDKNNEISSRIHYIARDLCMERILCAGGLGGTPFSPKVAQYFINQLRKATTLCHKCKIFGVVPPPGLAAPSPSGAHADEIQSEILLFRQQGCYHLKLMLGSTAEIIEGDADGACSREQFLKDQDEKFIEEFHRNVLGGSERADYDYQLDVDTCCKQQPAPAVHVQPPQAGVGGVSGGGGGAAAEPPPERSFVPFMKPRAILEMEKSLKHELPPTPTAPLSAKKDMSAVRDHIKDLVREQFRACQKRQEAGEIREAIREAISLHHLPQLPTTVEMRDEVDRCLYADHRISDTVLEMVVLVAPSEPATDPSDMIVRFRLTQVAGARGLGGDADAGSPRQVNTQTHIEAYYMSGQTIDAWNSFKYALNSKLLKKSSKEIKRDMLVNTDKLLTALKKAIETPEEMEINDINGLTAHIACMMAYTQAVEKGDGDEKDDIRVAVGNFHKRFDTAWR